MVWMILCVLIPPSGSLWLLLQKRILKKTESERNSDDMRFLEEYTPVINSFYNDADEHMIRIITKQVDAVLLNTTTK